MFDPVLLAALSGTTFSPRTLFAGGEQGAWYDPSDFSTMFQDSAGSTPVTAVEQPVGLIRDKSGRNNHASQATAGSRPVLSARVNLLTYSEQFNNVVWDRNSCTITANATTGPDGAFTADKVVSAAATASTGVAETITSTTGAHTFSVFVKADGATFIQLLWNAPTSTNYANFNISSGTITAGTYTDAKITSYANGWCRIAITSTSASTTITANVWAVDTGAAGRGASFTGDGTKGFFVWGADLRVTNDGVGIPAYQRVNAATDYDTSGFPLYLAFDGTDDSLSTASIDFSTTNKMSVFAGVRKLSDSAQRVVVELTADITLNNGGFLLSAPNSAAANFNFSSKGTTQVDNTVTTYAAPITSIITGQGDISAPSNVVQVNGVQVGSVATTQGTGNYANAALNIGRRGGATLPFSGRLYGLIVRGAATNADQLSRTEAWVNFKTSAY